MYDKTVSWEIAVDGKGDRIVFEQRMSELAVKELEVDSERLLDVLAKVKAYLARGMRLQWMSKFAHNKDQRYMAAMTSTY